MHDSDFFNLDRDLDSSMESGSTGNPRCHTMASRTDIPDRIILYATLIQYGLRDLALELKRHEEFRFTSHDLFQLWDHPKLRITRWHCACCGKQIAVTQDTVQSRWIFKHTECPNQTICDLAQQIATDLGDQLVPGCATIYNWIMERGGMKR